MTEVRKLPSLKCKNCDSFKIERSYRGGLFCKECKTYETKEGWLRKKMTVFENGIRKNVYRSPKKNQPQIPPKAESIESIKKSFIVRKRKLSCSQGGLDE